MARHTAGSDATSVPGDCPGVLRPRGTDGLLVSFDLISGAAGPSPQLVGVRVCLSYPGAWHFHKFNPLFHGLQRIAY